MSHPLIAFFVLTYLVSWTCFMSATPGTPVFLVGVFAPSIVALVLIALREGRTGVAAFLRRSLIWPAGVWWLVLALGYMIVIKLSAAVLHRLIAGGWPAFGSTPLYVMAGAIIVSTPVQAGEELGWRGFVLPRLAGRIGLAPAAIVLGVAWACWHLPLFFTPATDTFQQSFPLYALNVTAISVAMAWLYWRTGGSVLATMVMHAAVNNTKDIVPSASAPGPGVFALAASEVAWLTAILLWVCGVYFLGRMRRATITIPSTEDSVLVM